MNDKSNSQPNQAPTETRKKQLIVAQQQKVVNKTTHIQSGE